MEDLSRFFTMAEEARHCGNYHEAIRLGLEALKERIDLGIDECNYKTHNSWQTNMWKRLKGTKLKSGRIIRYADDFVIFCKTEKEAKSWYHATKDLDKRQS